MCVEVEDGAKGFNGPHLSVVGVNMDAKFVYASEEKLFRVHRH